MPPRQYRSALVIIQLILEELMKVGDEGVVKSQIYANLGLKTAVGEKYLDQLVNAEYLTVNEEQWGKERTRHVVRATMKGIQRFNWFIKLSTELDLG
jgi:predicted transcriptional regulator